MPGAGLIESRALLAFLPGLARSNISGNNIGANIVGGTILTLGDNLFTFNTTDVSGGSLTPVAPK